MLTSPDLAAHVELALQLLELANLGWSGSGLGVLHLINNDQF
jgi:hypothetical protein